MQKLSPDYIIGFIDGEGSFSVSVSKHKTLKRRLEIRPEFEMELRADDREILERIRYTLGCGRIYHLGYERYGWYPHAKMKISNIKDLTEVLLPFIDRHPLQAKKRFVYKLFREIVLMVKAKKHLTENGFRSILKKRDHIRTFAKKHY